MLNDALQDSLVKNSGFTAPTIRTLEDSPETRAQDKTKMGSIFLDYQLFSLRIGI
jgi:hypothetical protein